MRRTTKVVVVVGCVLSALALLAYAQRPPDYAPDGTPFLQVQINPTDIPPGVNINPNRLVPVVDIGRMPDLRFPPPSGCADARNFHTAIGASIAGPLVVTYINAPPQTSVRLIDGQSSQSVTLSQTQIASAIYLGGGQALEFGSSVMYSGCSPD